MTPLQQVAEQARSLYEITGDIKDINKMVVERSTLRQALELEQQAEPKKGSYEAVFGHLEMTPNELGNYMIALQQQDEPVAWVTSDDVRDFNSGPGESIFLFTRHSKWNVPLYTRPQPAQQLIVPPGYKLVPVEPTQWMLTQGEEGFESKSITETWRRMLAAAPEAPNIMSLTEAQSAILAAVERAIDFTNGLVRDAKCSQK